MNLPQLTTKTKAAIGGTALLASFAVGRYTVPEKVKTETKTVTVEKVVYKDREVIADHKKEHVVVVEDKKPDGEVVTKTDTTYDDTKTDKKTDTTNTDTTTTADKTQEVTRGDSKVTLSALAGLRISDKTPVYGVSISKPILGPLTIGIWGLNDSSVGCSIGFTF
jgi:hypothetical protein